MNIDLIKKYNVAGPRYTSYPPATFFSTNFTESDYKNCIIESNSLIPQNVSLYIHIPFCRQLCHFCGCNTSLICDNSLISKYIDALLIEIKTLSQLLDKNRKITQIHWGGGTPNSIDFVYIEKVMNLIYNTFTVSPVAEVAMECNPAYLEKEHIIMLARMGFNRLSLGIQDFDNKVLQNVNRIPSKFNVNEIVTELRNSNFIGVNLDFVYGLPGQNVNSFAKTMKQAIEINPERIVTFSYAHVPWFKSAQKILEAQGLPTPDDKLRMFEAAFNLLSSNNYVSIGMDHYSKPEDELYKALINKKLHRNFQGYCTRETTGQVYGIGATSISQMENAYSQNVKNVVDYINSIQKNGVAIERGYKLSDNTKIVRHIINEIMCNGYLNFNDVASRFNISINYIKQITKFDPAKLVPFINDNLLLFDNEEIKLNSNGFLVVRNVAMIFDPLFLEVDNKYSKTV